MSDNSQYQKGYRAGRKKGAEDAAKAAQMTDAEFFDAVMLQALPTAMTVQGWTIGEEKITSGTQRTKLAALWAADALKHRKTYGPRK